MDSRHLTMRSSRRRPFNLSYRGVDDQPAGKYHLASRDDSFEWDLLRTS